MTPVLAARGLACGYGSRQVLGDVHLEVRAGERVVLLGPNGSGKSTLLKTLAGLLRPLGGELSLDGDKIGRLSVREVARRVATVPQEESPRFSFSVRQIVTMGRLPFSDSFADSPEDRDIATEAMTSADCLHLEDRLVGELSGGERQRVLIARALAQKTRVILFDEPTSHLDPSHQLAVAQLVRSLAEGGIATIAAVHDLNFAAHVADRAILIDQGKVVMDDAVRAVLMSPILDRVYGVAFYRLEIPDGGGLLVAPAPGPSGP